MKAPKISDAIWKAKFYYDKKGFEHAARVAAYVADMGIIPEEDEDFCVALAFMHDLVEDTEFSLRDISDDFPYFKGALKLLTKNKEVSYPDYCKNIKEKNHLDYGRCAYYVKLADMKDHLSQTETLTDKLKEKYLKGLAYLL